MKLLLKYEYRIGALGVYLLFAAFLTLLWVAGSHIEVIAGDTPAFSRNVANIIITVITFTVMSALSEYFNRAMHPESFVLAIFIGMAGSGLLGPLTGSPDALTVVVNVSAAIILLQGGLEIKFQNFRKLFLVIAALSLVGLFVTAVAFTFSVLLLAQVFGIAMLPHVALLLGAILASTDPAALVPLFKKMQWIDESARDVIIAESAGTDVTGTILTLKLMTIVGPASAIAGFNVWSDGYAHVLTWEAAEQIGREMIVGLLAGLVGWLCLLGLSWFKKDQVLDHGVDALLVKGIGVAAFFLACRFHGSGFLAVFLAGLFFNVPKHMQITEYRVGDSIDAIFKAAVFVTLGAIVDINLLLQYAPIGIAAAVAFMAVNRPLGVLASLLPFSPFKRIAVSKRDMLFIASVRETGAIPAVLLLTVKTSGLPGSDMLVAIGTWVILMTLVVGPLYKRLLARKLGIAE